MSKDEFKGMVVEITGLESKSRVVQLICQTFESLRAFADFKVPTTTDAKDRPEEEAPPDGGRDSDRHGRSGLDLGLSYTINLVLPKSDDPGVFNAIFKSLRDNLLRK